MAVPTIWLTSTFRQSRYIDAFNTTKTIVELSLGKLIKLSLMLMRVSIIHIILINLYYNINNIIIIFFFFFSKLSYIYIRNE